MYHLPQHRRRHALRRRLLVDTCSQATRNPRTKRRQNQTTLRAHSRPSVRRHQIFAKIQSLHMHSTWSSFLVRRVLRASQRINPPLRQLRQHHGLNDSVDTGHDRCAHQQERDAEHNAALFTRL
jgi:hypothetical protein